MSIPLAMWAMGVLITAMLSASFGFLLASCVDFER